LHKRTLTRLIDYYINSLRLVDQRQREFEESVGKITDSELIEPAIAAARDAYRKLVGKVQLLFTTHLEQESYPPAGRLINAAVFDTLVAPRLSEKGRRVAYLMVDALRYELGVELERLLTEIGTVELIPAYAQLPTITLVGMASLLPGAQNDLTLDYEKDKLVPKLAGTPVSTVTQRMAVFRKRYGDRFTELLLKDFIGAGKKAKVADTVELLVLRSREIDSQLEHDPDNTLTLIPRTLKLIRAALNKLSQLGFQDAVIATDHGFFLNAHAEDGDTCLKPTGEIQYSAHDRMVFGNFSKDSHNLVLNSDKLGIRGSFPQAAFPRTMAPYSAGHRYFHGGLSLAEAIVPVLKIQLNSPHASSTDQFDVQLSYKNGAKYITTRLPVINLSLVTGLFNQSTPCEVLLEAQDSKGNVVGEPRPGADVNPTTRTITLIHGQSKQIVLRMDTEFEGKFTIKALNPNTLTTYASLDLATDYTV
jgi:PglZ domain